MIYQIPSVHQVLSKTVLIAAGATGLFNFAATELVTGDKVFASVLMAISIPAAAYFAARPKIIAAQAAREAAERTGNMDRFNALMEQMTGIHAQEVKIKERQIEEKDMEIKMLRISKHNLLGPLQTAQSHINLLELLLQKQNIDFPRFVMPLIEDLTHDEDKTAKELVNSAATRIASAAAADVAGNGGKQHNPIYEPNP